MAAIVITKSQALRAESRLRAAAVQAAEYDLPELAARDARAADRMHSLSLSLAARLYAALGTGKARDLTLTALVLAVSIGVVYVAHGIGQVL